MSNTLPILQSIRIGSDCVINGQDCLAGTVVTFDNATQTEIDCRQCEKYKNGAGEKWCGVHIKPCTNGDKFVKLPAVQLWAKVGK